MRRGVCDKAHHRLRRRGRMGVQVRRVHAGVHDAVSHRVYVLTADTPTLAGSYRRM